MSNSRKLVLCIFCDKRGKRSREDIIPRWIAVELGGKAPFYGDVDAAYTPDGRPAKRKDRKYGSLATLKLPDVCATCNNGWMSRLERQAMAVLLPMIRGQSTVLDHTGQRIVAAWGQLKLISIDAYYHDRRLPPSSAHEFAQHLQPSGQLAVTVGAFSGWSDGVGILHPRRFWQGDLQRDNTHRTLVRVTLVVGHLVVQMAQLEPYDGSGQNHTPTHDTTTLTQIWPRVTDQVHWPPSRLLDLRSLTEIV